MPYILVVDDDIDARALVVLSLQESGFKAVGASNGLEAMLLMTETDRQTKPFLILLDLNMPIMTGQQFIQIMKCCDHLATTPIVIVTGEAVAPAGYVTVSKPLTLEKLLSLAREYKERALKSGSAPPGTDPA